MSYDFTKYQKRYQTDSRKWSFLKDAEALPFYIADMEFETAPEIREALHRRIDQGYFGYSIADDQLLETIITYQKSMHGFDVQPEWILFVPSLAPFFAVSALALTEKEQEVVIFRPCYPPFYMGPKGVGRKVVEVKQTYDDNKWYPDFEALEAAITPQSKYFILSNPENPTGRVWTAEGLDRLLDICEKHNLILCSDEIHCDLILESGLKHISTLAHRPDAAKYTFTITSHSKTYNTPALMCAYLIVPNPELRRIIKSYTDILSHCSSSLGFVSLKAAYELGEPWRQELLKVLRRNAKIIYDFFDQIPNVKTWPVEATYIAWIDFRELGLDNPSRYFEKFGVSMTDGAHLGFPGFCRLIFACPEEMLREGLQKIEEGINALNEK